MPQKIAWTERADATILTMRQGGATWDGIARVIGVSRNAALDRGRLLLLGLADALPARAPRPARAAPVEDPARAPLPPGHPVSWAVLTEGTSLESTPYPLALVLGRDPSARG
ncbi:MAG TPA: AsnC family protein [Acetobacteraceae bacterium]|nr:AsnC family protein [Acetobacteraceae bacterium]